MFLMGTKPGEYRLWKRRAQLMIAGLPSTVSEKKYGPRLMEFIKGEAETLLENISVEDLMKTGGDERIWEILDEKYGPQPRDLLQHAMKNFFYDLQVRPSETFTQFLARFAAAMRLLKEQAVELPAPVAGYMLLKKLRLEASQESMVLTHSQGKMDWKEIERAVRDIFPEGRGSTKSQKEVFQAEDQGRDPEPEVTVLGEDQELHEAAELIAAEFQERGSEDEEEALEAFESYLDIKRKLREQKTNRGYRPKAQGDQWKLSGTVKGKLELLKAKTTCHLCRQRGHWKRECPNRKTNAGAGAASSTGKASAEVHSAEGGMGAKEILLADDDLWHRFEIDAKGVNSVAASRRGTGSPTPESQSDTFVTVEVLVNDQDAQMSVFDDATENVAVPDTACRRTLIGAYTLRRLEQHLGSQGLKVIRRSEPSEFRFGNDQTLTSTEAVILPACVHGRRFLIRAAMLPQSWTPLLLSKEFLRQLEWVLDLSLDRLWMFGRWVDLVETKKGHYGLKCFEFDHDETECCVSEHRKGRTMQSEGLGVDSVWNESSWLNKNPSEKPTVFGISGEHGLCSSEPARQPRSAGDAAQSDSIRTDRDGRLEELNQGLGHHAGCGRRRAGTPCSGRSCLQGGQVQGGQQDHGHDLHGRKGLHGVGTQAHRHPFWTRDAEAQALHHLPRCSQAEPTDEGPDAAGPSTLSDANHDTCEGTGKAQEHGRQSCSTTGSGNGTREHGVADRGECGSPVDDHRDGGWCADSACESHGLPLGERRRSGGEGDGRDDARGGRCLGLAAAAVSEPKPSDQEHVMSKKNRLKLKRNVVGWCDEHGCGDGSVVCCGSEDDEIGPHEVFHVNLQTGFDCAEVFSMPRILPVAEKKGLKGLKSYDIGLGWNFLKAEDRQKCLSDIKKYKPELVTISPPCGFYSILQACSLARQNPEERKRKEIEARVLPGFAMQICELQHQEGRGFVFEHPIGARSWGEEEVKRVRNFSNTHEVILDQCQFGLKDPQNGKFYRKRTRLLTNIEEMKRLGCVCNHEHEHQRVEGQTKVGGKWVNRSRVAQVYPKRMVEQMVVAFIKYRNRKGYEVLAAEALQEDRNDLERSVRRCHVNLGHPSRERFIHMLRTAGASDKALEIAKGLKCSVCDSHRVGPSHAVSKHKRAEGFNQQLDMDTFEIPIFGGKTLKMLNMFDEGTGLQICVPLWKGATAKNVRSAYRKHWKRWAGVPIKVFTDGGTEFDKEVQQGFETDGTFVEKSATYNPWQNGYVEKHGDLWKTAFKKAFDETAPLMKRLLRPNVKLMN